MEVMISVILFFVAIGVLGAIHLCIIASRASGENQGVVDDDDQRRENVVGNIDGTNRKMSIEELKMIPCFDYVASEKGTDCAVCLESFKGGEKCRLLPYCNHTFHSHCIDSWLLKTPICPICRTCSNPSTKAVWN